MADDTVDIEKRIAAMALQWIANAHAMIARGRRVLAILEFCHAAPPEPGECGGRSLGESRDRE